MFYRLLLHLLQPFTVLMILVLVVQIIWWYKRVVSRKTICWTLIPTVILYLFRTPAVAHLMVGTLEWSYAPIYQRPADTTAIVVLSSAIRPPDAVRRKAELDTSGMYRCIKGAEMYHSGLPCKVVLAGGRVDSEQAGPTLAAAMSDFMVQLGIDREDIVLDDRSRSTYENAVNSAALLRQRNMNSILLVTDATHLRRAILCFEKQGIQVVGCGCQYRATQFEGNISSFFPSFGAADTNQAVLHEWLGLTWYWLTNRI